MMINGKIIYVARISCVLTHNTSVNEIKKLEVLHTYEMRLAYVNTTHLAVWLKR